MIWRWWRDWRERRAALAEMVALRRHEEALVMDQSNNPLNLAMLSASAGNLEAAASQWERARSLVPTAVLESPDSLDILLALERYDEAEQLMRDRRKRSPGDRIALTGLAAIAERRGDPLEALKRWKAARDGMPDTVDGYHGYIRCLIELGRLDEAESQSHRAIRRDSMHGGSYAYLATVSDRRKNWPQSLERWKYLAEHHDDPRAYARVANALLELGKADEAEASLAEPSLRFVNNEEIAVTYAELAQRRGDLTAAADRWARVRAIKPFFPRAYHEGVDCLVKAGRHADADDVLRAAIKQFPDEAWPSRDFARNAHDRGDWNEAAARWEALRLRFPEAEEGHSLGAEALRAAGRDAEADALDRRS